MTPPASRGKQVFGSVQWLPLVKRTDVPTIPAPMRHSVLAVVHLSLTDRRPRCATYHPTPPSRLCTRPAIAATHSMSKNGRTAGLYWVLNRRIAQCPR